MTLSRRRLVLGAVAVSESAWVFAIAGTVALVLGRDVAPIAWPALLMILASGIVIARYTPTDVDAIELVAVGRVSAGAVLIYLTIATQVNPAGGLELAWPATMLSNTVPDGLAFRAIVGTVLGAVLWWRAGRLAEAEDPVGSLTLSMRFGVVALGVGMIVDVAVPADLAVFPVVFVFFAAGLSGLAIGHLMPETRREPGERVWPRVIAAVVALVLGVGLLFSLVRSDLLAYLTRPAAWLLGMAAKAILFVVVFPISFVVNLVVDVLTSFFSGTVGRFTSEAEQSGGGGEALGLGLGEAEALEEEAESFTFILQILELAILVVVVAVALYILLKLFRRFFGGQTALPGGSRESVGGDANVFGDLRRLLSKLVPGLLKGRRARSPAPPEGPGGIVEVFRIYYRLLALAEKRGVTRPKHQTVAEFQPALEKTAPADLVKLATLAFERACYGHHPASPEQIDQMWAALRAIAPSPLPRPASLR